MSNNLEFTRYGRTAKGTSHIWEMVSCLGHDEEEKLGVYQNVLGWHAKKFRLSVDGGCFVD